MTSQPFGRSVKISEKKSKKKIHFLAPRKLVAWYPDTFVLRQRGGRTLLSSRPTGSSVVSDKQQEQRDRFQRAVRYARTALLRPEVKAEYEALVKGKEFLSSFTAAVTDYLKAPEITSIDLSAYKGLIGDVIAIQSAVDYKFVSVNVKILQADGTELESGEATAADKRLEWLYVAKQAITLIAGMKIVATVADRPGNVIVKEQAIL
jgi:hypothetical protein